MRRPLSLFLHLPGLAGLLAALVAAACGPTWKDVSRMVAPPVSDPTSPPVHDRQRTWYDREATRPRSEVSLLLDADGRDLKDGVERRWFPDGTLELERTWSRGEPRGPWRTWWPNGKLRFEHRYEPDEATPMRWWYESGVLSSTGLSRDGRREGPWRAWHPGGAPAYEGGYVAGRRAGLWTFWHPDGSLAQQGDYEADTRVGTWELYAPGEVPGAAPHWESESAAADQ